MKLSDFASMCFERALAARECSPTHWQVKGVKLVNFYPTSGTIHVDGAPASTQGTVYDAIAIAQDRSLPSLFP